MLEGKGLKKSFKGPEGRIEVLRGISLSLPDRGLFAIMGRSGAGKSTLLSLIAGIEKPSDGTIEIGGIDYRRLTGKQAAALRNKEIGFLFQHYNLLEDFDVSYNVCLPALVAGKRRNEAEQRANELLKKLGLEGKQKQSAATLSGGEKQRAALARALMNEPSLILADEPTGALDSASAKVVMDVLKEESRKRLVLLVTHNEELASEYADRIFRLENGHLMALAEGERKKLRKPKRRSLRQKAIDQPILKRNLREDAWSNLASYGVAFVSFAVAFIGLGAAMGAEASIEAKKYEYAECAQATFGGSETIVIEGSPLNLRRSYRPEKDLADAVFSDIENVSVADDYSYFFPTAATITSDEEAYGPVSLIPLFDLSLSDIGTDFLLEGSLPKGNDFTKCFGNEAFFDDIPLDIGSTVTFSSSVGLAEGEATHDFEMEFEFEIAGKIKEFSYLTTPKLFYSYSGLRELMHSYELPDVFGGETIGDLVAEADGESAYSSYRYLVFCHKKASLPAFWERILEIDEEDAFFSDSFSLTAVTSYSDIFGALLALLPFFVGVGFLASLFLTFALAYSRYLKRKKEGAILSSIGEDYEAIVSPYLYEGCAPVLLGTVSAMAGVYFLQEKLNAMFLSLFGLENLMQVPFENFLGIPYLLPILALLVALLVSFFAVIFGARALIKGKIYEELRDE